MASSPSGPAASFSLSPQTTLSLGDTSIEHVVHIHVHNLIIAATGDLKIHVYKVEKDSDFILVHTFDKHEQDITGLVNLSDDILCSVIPKEISSRGGH